MLLSVLTVRGLVAFVCCSQEDATSFGLQVLNEGIEASIFGDDVKVRGRLGLSQLSNVVGDVKVEGVGTVTGDLDIAGSRSELLKRCRSFKRYFRLIGANENQEFEVVECERLNGGRLNVLEVDEDVVGAHVCACDA